jgi:multisubunit Na+/H+ antiporter MnhB subunit
MTAMVVFDGLLAGIVLVLAAAVLFAPDLRRSAMLFIAFGLVVALIWARLRAPDLALAEAAIGAGLTGAMLLLAARDRAHSPAADDGPGDYALHYPSRLLPVLPLVVAVLLLGWAFLVALAAPPERLAGTVAAAVPESGVENPVTAVLLNFRAYDTLLELAVLLVAVLGIRALGPARPARPDPGPVFTGLVSWLVPLLIVVGAYLLWVGAYAPGGAFQAGALLAGAGVLLHLAGHPRAGLPSAAALRGLLVGGVGVFVGVGIATWAFGTGFLDYPPAWAATLILLIETAATLAIAATLVAAYLGGTIEDPTP